MIDDIFRMRIVCNDIDDLVAMITHVRKFALKNTYESLDRERIGKLDNVIDKNTLGLIDITKYEDRKDDPDRKWLFDALSS